MSSQVATPSFDLDAMFSTLTNETSAEKAKVAERRAKAKPKAVDNATKQERLIKAAKQYGPAWHAFATRVENLERIVKMISDPRVTHASVFGTADKPGAFDVKLFATQARRAIVKVEKLLLAKSRIGA